MPPEPHITKTSALIGRLWRDWISPYRWRLALILLLIGLIAGSTALYPLFIKAAFDRFANRDISDLGWLCLGIMVVTSVKGFSMLGQLVMTNAVVSRVEMQLRAALYAKLIDADLLQVAHESPAVWTQRFSTDFLYIREAMSRLVNVVIRDVITAIALLGAMLWIDWQLTLIVFAVAPLFAWPVMELGKRLRRLSRRVQEQVGQMAGHVAESLAGLRVAKTYRLEPYLKARAGEAFDMIRRLTTKGTNARSRLDPILEIGAGLAIAAVLLAIGARIGQGRSTLGDFTGFVTALLLAAQPIRSLGNINVILQEAASALERTFAVLDTQPRIREKPDAKPLAIDAGTLRFEQVVFRYRDDQDALSGIDLEAMGGRRTALVGASGSGKSTLVSLVPRLYDASAGRVTIDGQNVQDVTLASLRDAVTVVSQDVLLFDDTIRANILFGRPEAREAEIEAAAKAAAAHEFITRLPDGYLTCVGDRGGNLSGGERQRIMLARAFLKDAPILLLDEATSALDAQSEKLVQDALDRLMKGRTTLVVAHRLSTIRDADLIVVFDQGRIVETGRHDDLMQQNGVYASLCRLQFGQA
jgi:ATP-binding cassette, subfamily B, bacterial MsbA